MESMHVVTAANDNFVLHVAVMFYSLLENKTTNIPVHLYVLDSDISSQNKRKLNRVLKRFNVEVRFLSIDPSIYEGFKKVHHLTKETYYRYSIPGLLDESIHKVLYLDGDIVINGDITELWNINIDDYYVAAAEDPGVGTSRHKDLSVPKGFGHFNAGVLLMNLTKWRESSLFSKLVEFIQNNSSKILWCSQDPLNALLYDKWLTLDPKWNYQTATHRNPPYPIDPIIIHFNEISKPWNDIHPLQDEYFRYADTVISEWFRK